MAVSNAVTASRDLRLVEAVKGRNKEAVGALLKQEVDVNVPGDDGSTPLAWAVHWDDLATVDSLLRAGADVNAANDLRVTPLSLACVNGSAPMVELLLKSGAAPNAVIGTGETPLMTAARTGNVEVVQALLAHGAEVDAKEPSHGQTALMWAVAEQHREVAQVLIEHGADVHAHSETFTPLLFAAREGDLDTVRLLLAAGSNVNETASDGSSVLVVATVRDHAALAQFLLDQGADANAAGAGYTALHWAAGTWETALTGVFGFESWMSGLKTGKPELVKALLAHGANPNARLTKNPPKFGDSQARGVSLIGATPFALAALAADAGMMRILAAGGADPLLRTNDNTTPLMLAAGLGRVRGESPVTESQALEAVKLSLELGNDVNAVNDAGSAALHGVAYLGWDAMVQYLVDSGERVNVKNKRGDTPVLLAEGKGLRIQGDLHVYKSTSDLLIKLGGIDEADNSGTDRTPRVP
jgi:ankyrin repeat protein